MAPVFTLIILAKILTLLHTSILLFLVLGFLSNTSYILVAHIISVLLVITHWRLNNGKCALTEYEATLKEAVSAQRGNKKAKENPCSPKEHEPFVRKVLSRLGVNLTDKHLKTLIYTVLYTSTAISIYKLL